MFDMFEFSPVPQFAVDLDSKVTCWNKSCEILTGYPAEKMLGTDRQWEPFYKYKRPVLADLLVRNDTGRVPELYGEQGVVPTGIVPLGWEGCDYFADLNGRNRHIRFIAAPVRDSVGKVVGAVETLLEVPRKSCTKGKQHNTANKANTSTRPGEVSYSAFNKIVGTSSAMTKVYQKIASAAAGSGHVIIYGESGTGKELTARTIHDLSDRNSKAFIAVNCGAIPETLIESEFFGHRKGAFSGADQDKPGLLESADGGTLFLDEIGEMSQSMQVKLLRVLDGSGFSPVGCSEIRKPDIRFIAATKRNLLEEVRRGRMREDFFYRIHILPVRLPLLRERKGDIPLLIHSFVEKYSHKSSMAELPDSFAAKLLDYSWPGNIRELENVIQRYLVLGEIDFPDELSSLPDSADKEKGHAPAAHHDLRSAVANLEKEMLLRTLERCHWKRSKAASILKVSRKTLLRKMKIYGLA